MMVQNATNRIQMPQNHQKVMMPIMMLQPDPTEPLGISWHSVNPVETCPLILATAITAAYSSTLAPGQLMAEPHMRPPLTKQPVNNKLLLLKKFRQAKDGAHGLHALHHWGCAKIFLAA